MRTLSWDGCVNVRDLGGLPTEDGAITRFGRAVRADSVRGLTDAGWEALVGHGVSRIVDLRWADELAEDAWIDEAPDEGEREFRRMLSRCPPEAITGVLAELETRYGGVDAYLSEGGASKDTLAASRARLLDP